MGGNVGGGLGSCLREVAAKIVAGHSSGVADYAGIDAVIVGVVQCSASRRFSIPQAVAPPLLILLLYIQIVPPEAGGWSPVSMPLPTLYITLPNTYVVCPV